MAASIEERVTFWSRLGAICIDLILIIIVGGLVSGIVGDFFGKTSGSGSQEHVVDLAGSAIVMYAVILIGIPIFGLVYNLLEGFTGATFGKMILGYKIGNANGTKARVGKLLLRYGIKNIAVMCLIVALFTKNEIIAILGSTIGIVWFVGCFLAIGKTKQGLHDVLVRTAVYPKQSLI